MAVAGLAVNVRAVAKIADDLAAVNRKFGLASEVKWATVKRYSGKGHRLYIQYLRNLTTSGMAHFHIRFVDMQLYDHALSGSRKRVDTVSKSFYQIILHRAIRYYGSHANLLTRLDDGDCTAELASYLGAFHSQASSKGLCQRDCIKGIRCIDSAREPMLQLLDVTLGAFAAHRNGRHEHSGANPTKRAVIGHALRTFGIETLAQDTPRNAKAFSVWNAKPSWTRSDGPRA